MLEIRQLSKSFDGFAALDAVSLTVRTGQCHALIGPNGAGKTTLFDVVTGHLAPDQGQILLNGTPLTGQPPHRLVQQGLARSFQHLNIFPRLGVADNVQVALIARHRQAFNWFRPSARQHGGETAHLLELVGLAQQAHEEAGRLAYGQQKQLELALALAARPRLLLLDEPTAGMAPQETTAAMELIGRVAAQRNLTLLFTEHDMDVVFGLADHISVLDKGHLIASGPPAAIRLDPTVQQVYLGAADES